MKGTEGAVAAAGRPGRDVKRAGAEASLEIDVDGGASSSSSSSSNNSSNKRQRGQRGEEKNQKATHPEDTGSSSACSTAAVKREKVDGDVMVTDTNDARTSSFSNNNNNNKRQRSSSQQPEAHQQKRAVARAGEGLPDACLGPGPAWSLREACARSSARMQKDAAQEGLPHHCRIPMSLTRGMLLQALSCSRETDVRIVVDDGAMIGGHRAVLCLSCEGFRAMFESGMREDEEGVVRMAGVGISAVKALLEWVYLGERLVADMPFRVSLFVLLDIDACELAMRCTIMLDVLICGFAKRPVCLAMAQAARGRSARRPTGGSCGCSRRCTTCPG